MNNKEISKTSKYVPLLLLLVVVIAFGLLIPWLGFYWDDLPFIWLENTYGAVSMIGHFQGDRPLLALIFMVTTSIFKHNALAWQIFALFCRWCVAMIAFWTFSQVWPRRLFQNTLAAAFIAVFPGFSQHWISVTYSNVYLLMCLSMLSIGLTIKALRQPQYFWGFTFLSLLTAAFNLFSIEYFFGQEFLRPFFIWYVLAEKKKPLKTQISLVLKHWAPTLLVLAAYITWRIFFFESDRYRILTPDSMQIGVIAYLFHIIKHAINDFNIGVLYGWGKIFSPPNALDWNSATTMIFWTLAISSVGLFFFLFRRIFRIEKSTSNSDMETLKSDQWGKQAMLCGILVCWIATLPYLAAGLDFSRTFPNDRNAISMMVGSSLLVAGLIDDFIQSQKKQIIIACVLISLSIGSHFISANSYRREWDQLRYFFWQLNWRVPSLKPGTIVVSNELPFNYYTDNSLTAPLNWLYAPHLNENKIPYWFAYARLRSQSDMLDFTSGSEFSVPYRAVSFTGRISNSVGLYMENPGCLRIIDQQSVDELLLPKKWDWIYTAAAYSNLNSISNEKSNSGQVPAMFGAEPLHDWCFFFQKADLARQNQNWTEIIQLASQSLSKGIKPKNPEELFPFIEGYLMTGQPERATELLNQIVKSFAVDLKEEKTKLLCLALANIQTRTGNTSSSQSPDWFNKSYQEIGC